MASDAVLSSAATTTGGVVLLTVIAIAYGGTFLLKVTRGGVPTNDLQRSFFRAGHAHAGMLVVLGLVVTLYTDLAGVTGLAAGLSGMVLIAAILMPAGFFLSVIGKDPAAPNRLIVLLWAGAGALVVGLLAAAIGLLTV